MDSINKQQAEENYEDLHSAEAVKKLKELVDKAKSCFFCTRITGGEAFSTAPCRYKK